MRNGSNNMAEPSMTTYITNTYQETWVEDPRFPNVMVQLLVSQTHTSSASVIRVRVQPSGQISSHVHVAETEIIWIEQGRPVLVIDDKDYLLEAGSCAVIPPGSTHSLHNPGDDTVEILAVHTPPVR